jgi:hypothetical protein
VYWDQKVNCPKKVQIFKKKLNLFSKIYFENRKFECSPFWKNTILRLLYGSSQQQYLYFIYVGVYPTLCPCSWFKVKKAAMNCLV